MSETSNTVSTPEPLTGDASEMGTELGKSTRSADKNSQLIDQINTAIANGDFKTALALGAGAPEIPAALMKQAQQGLDGSQSANTNATTSPDHAVSAAPPIGDKQLDPQPSSEISAAANTARVIEPAKPSLSELMKKALDNSTKLFELALTQGAGVAQEAKAAVAYGMQGIFSAVSSEGKSEKTPSEIVKNLDALVNSSLHKETANAGFSSIMPKETAHMLSNLVSNMVDHGTGNFSDLGRLPPTTVAQAAPEKQSERSGFSAV